MNKYIFKSLALGITSLLLGACNDSVEDLLEPKVYFENKEYNLTVEDGDVMSFELTSRLTSAISSDASVTYHVADASYISEYNAKYGTNYVMFDTNNVSLSSSSATIPSGSLYAEKVQLEFSNLSSMEEGKSYVLPISIQSSVPTTPGGDIAYFFIKKPVRITKAGQFYSDYISVKFPVGTYFQSFTYEALLYVDHFGNNNTVMGNEGIMILRIGDAGGGTTPRDIIEIAGNQHYNVKEPLKAKTWYHVAVTYDQGSGKTGIYVNGNKWAESAWAIPGFDPNYGVGFYIGKVYGFQWGERPFFGMMSEVRVWSVARTENQLKQNMYTVDPKSEGLELYYKLNGSETSEGGRFKDAVGKVEATTSGISIQSLEVPIEIK